MSLAATGAQATGGAGSDTLSGFEGLIGSSYADSLTGAGTDDILVGGMDNDTLTGAAGNGLCVLGEGHLVAADTTITAVTSPAPSSAPGRCPAPPTTAINRYWMPAFSPNGVGFTERCMCAYNHPASPASTAA